MLDTSNVELKSIFVHQIGNKLRQEGVDLSNAPLELSRKETQSLLYYFFNHFTKVEKIHRLTHPAGSEQNAILAICSRIFKGAPLSQEGRKSAEHLYDVSDHPKINAGNLFIAHFANLKFEGKVVEGVGFFKADHSDEFLNVDILKGRAKLSVNSGTRIKSFDKGALILNQKPSDGYRVMGAVSHFEESIFWVDKFLKIEEVADDSTHTRDLIKICRQYSKVIPDHDAASKVKFLESAYAYLKDSVDFRESDFVAALPAKNRASFSEFNEKSQKVSEKRIPAEFKVSPIVVKRQNRFFKSVITLDNRIEIKINSSLLGQSGKAIEKGYDEKTKRNFYKIYYNEES